MVLKELTKQDNMRNRKVNQSGHTAAQKARAAVEDKEEHTDLENQALEESTDFKFPKVYLMMHWVDQISHYGCLLQYSTEICETSYQPLKGAYRQSNHIDSIPQIIQGYTWAHSFRVRELDMAAWALEDPAIKVKVMAILRVIHKDTQLVVPDDKRIFMTLGGKRSIKEIYHLSHLAEEYMIPEIGPQIQQFFERNICGVAADPQSDARNILQHGTLDTYNTLEITVPDQNVDDNSTYKLQNLCASGWKAWQG